MDDNGDSVNSIINQLQTIPKIAQKYHSEQDELTKENLHENILKYSNQVIKAAVDVVNSISGSIQMGATPEETSAFAEVVRSATGAIDTLSKLHVAEERNQTAVKIKNMDVDSRRENVNTAATVHLLANREELLEKMLKLSMPRQPDAIEVEAMNVTEERN